MNKIGQYDDGLSNYSFNFSDNDGKHINVSFRAESDYDLDTIFNEFRNFLIAAGHDIEGQIGELFHEEDEWEDGPMERTQFEPKDKFSMDNIPNNNWMFGPNVKEQTWPTDAAAQYFSQQGMKQEQNWHNTWGSSSIPALTAADIAPLTVTNLETNQTYAYKDRLMQNPNPTMAPLTSQQIQSWSLSSDQIKSLTVADLSTWKVDAPGTLGGAKVKF